jgi:mono/diheme cytochrome c family protein
MRRQPVVLSVLLAAVGLLAAGCLGGKQETATPDKVVGTIATTTTPTANLPALKLKGNAAAGKTIFTGSAGCIGCHTLKDAKATGVVGPNLDQKKPPFALVVERVSLGKGAMPAFSKAKGGALTDQQIADVAQYVSSVAGH